jgi:hypothetical protein
MVYTIYIPKIQVPDGFHRRGPQRFVVIRVSHAGHQVMSLLAQPFETSAIRAWPALLRSDRAVKCSWQLPWTVTHQQSGECIFLAKMQNMHMSVFCIPVVGFTYYFAYSAYLFYIFFAYSAYYSAYSVHEKGYVHILHFIDILFCIFCILFCIFCIRKGICAYFAYYLHIIVLFCILLGIFCILLCIFCI